MASPGLHVLGNVGLLLAVEVGAHDGRNHLLRLHQHLAQHERCDALHELVRALGWPLIMVEGIEADDVIGTLTLQAKEYGWSSLVSTSDKDLAQLVDGQTRLVNTMTREGGRPEVLDEVAVFAKFGVRPDQIIDFLSLVGDAVDNVPGVDKVGPKTAAKWLAQYGNLDQLNFFAAYCFNAGATVVSFRPLGHQTNEVILDNDDAAVTYTGTWSDSSSTYYWGNPGDVPYRFSALNATETATATYTPTIPVARCLASPSPSRTRRTAVLGRWSPAMMAAIVSSRCSRGPI